MPEVRLDRTVDVTLRSGAVARIKLLAF